MGEDALTSSPASTSKWDAADYAKIGVRSRIGYCTPKDIDVLVTNRRAGKAAGMAAVAKLVGSVELA